MRPARRWVHPGPDHLDPGHRDLYHRDSDHRDPDHGDPDGYFLQDVTGALGGFLKKGEKALVTYAVDPAIVGGMVVSDCLHPGPVLSEICILR